jgi:uncharacterized tellurite resistance protein B-like protein
MEASERVLSKYSDREKGAYLAAIASIATADRSASEEELEYLRQLADEAELTDEQKKFIERAATELTGEDLTQCLDILKTSDLRYSLVTDLIAFAEADQNYSDEEKANVEKIAQYLGIDKKQVAFLDEFVKKTSKGNVTPEEAAKPGFMDQLGLGDKMKGAGINPNTMRTIIGVAAPFLLASLFRRRSRGMGMGGFGGGMFGGGGGIGSLIGMLSGGRGMRSTGGLFGRSLRGGGW